MKERPITFNAEMVRAILDGRKTQTRRPVNLPVIDRNVGCELAGNELAGEIAAGNYHNSKYGKPGDRLWVRETYATQGDESQFVAHYKADNQEHFSRPGMGFMSPVTMPRWASRITLEITGVRVERLRSMSELDARAEGVIAASGHMEAGLAFREIWDAIYGIESWQANPWVWVVEFKRLEAGQ